MKEIFCEDFKKEFNQEEINIIKKEIGLMFSKRINEIKILLINLKEKNKISRIFLNHLALNLNYSEYEPEIFKGLFYYPKNNKDLFFLFFDDGRVYSFSYKNIIDITLTEKELDNINGIILNAIRV